MTHNNSNFGMDKFNCFGLLQVFLTLFFKQLKSIDPPNGNGGLKVLLYGHTIDNEFGTIFELLFSRIKFNFNGF